MKLDIKALIRQINIKKLLLPNLPYIFIGYFVNKLVQAYRITAGADILEKIFKLSETINTVFKAPLPSFNGIDLLSGIIGAVLIRFFVYQKSKNAKKYRKGIEYGSASWGTHKDIEPFMNPVFQKNIPLTQTEWLTMESRVSPPKNARNKNIIVVGGSGSGKTRFFVKPSLMQMHSSYVVTDPKGTILVECGKMLADNGYTIKVFNTINFKKSMRYNPFAYIRSEKDILKLVNTIIVNTKGEGEKSGEDFWVKAERLYYTALIGYIWYEAPPEEQNFSLLLEMINASEVREEDEDFKNAIDYAFDIKELRDMMEYDEMELDKLGERKTAMFIIISDTDDTFNFVVAMLYSQMFNLLCDVADDKYNGRLPIHVRVLADEFANIGQIPKFDKLIATIRSREISASIILQSQSQLKAIYKDSADVITGNCDTMLFLGGKEKSTLKELSDSLGKETIDTYNTSENRGREKTYGLNYQKLGKELMTQDELSRMDGGKCILQIRGVKPFFSDKYDITKHPNYKYLSDYDKKNEFDVEKFVGTKAHLKPNDTVEVADMGEIEADDAAESED